MRQIVVGLHFTAARRGAHVKHPDVGTAASPDPENVQTGGDMRAHGNLRLYDEIVGGNHGALNFLARKGEIGEIGQAAAEKGYLDGFADGRAQRKNGTYRGGEVGQRAIGGRRGSPQTEKAQAQAAVKR